MQSGILLSQQDIKRIIAEHYHVTEDKVVPTKYSFFVIQEDDKKGDSFEKVHP